MSKWLFQAPSGLTLKFSFSEKSDEKNQNIVQLVFSKKGSVQLRNGKTATMYEYIAFKKPETFSCDATIDTEWKAPSKESDQRYPRLKQRIYCSLWNDDECIAVLNRSEVEFQKDRLIMKLGHHEQAIIRFSMEKKNEADQTLSFTFSSVWCSSKILF